MQETQSNKNFVKDLKGQFDNLINTDPKAQNVYKRVPPLNWETTDSKGAIEYVAKFMDEIKNEQGRGVIQRGLQAPEVETKQQFTKTVGGEEPSALGLPEFKTAREGFEQTMTPYQEEQLKIARERLNQARGREERLKNKQNKEIYLTIDEKLRKLSADYIQRKIDPDGFSSQQRKYEMMLKVLEYSPNMIDQNTVGRVANEIMANKFTNPLTRQIAKTMGLDVGEMEPQRGETAQQPTTSKYKILNVK